MLIVIVVSLLMVSGLALGTIALMVQGEINRAREARFRRLVATLDRHAGNAVDSTPAEYIRMGMDTVAR